MKLICLRSYSIGYTGFIEERDSYVYFIFPRKGKLKKLLKYHKADYGNYSHFIGGISKFISFSYFLKEPVVLESITIAELDKIFRYTSGQ